MQTIKDKIIYIIYEGKIDARNNKLVAQQIIALEQTIYERNLFGIYISIKDNPYDLNELKNLVAILESLSKKLNTSIALGDYDHKVYNILKVETKLTRVKLFKNWQIAKLLLAPKSFNKSLKVFIFDDGDEEDLEKISSILSKGEHSLVYIKDMTKFREYIETNKKDILIYETKINFIKVKNSISKKQKVGNFNLSKTLVSNLPIFVNTAVDTLTSITALEASKVSHEITMFEPSNFLDNICSVMEFHGEIDGYFLLMFPEVLAKKAIESMLQEKLKEENLLEDLLDGISEFCNIITGSIKTALSKKGINLTFDLPKASKSLINTNIPHNNGILIKMQLENELFHIFIVK
jgi:CheY-specific phosphatase CheX